MNAEFDVKSFDVAGFDKILEKGLCYGLGDPTKQVCIEAAICQTLGLPHSDDPGCVASSVRSYKIRLNDSKWSSPTARAKGLRDLGLAQLGSKGIVSNQEFGSRLASETIRVIIPALVREVFPNNTELLALADACEKDPTEANARAVQKAYAADAAAYAAAAAAAYAAAYAAAAAAYAASYAAAYAAAAADASYAADGDKYLLMSAAIALQILKDLKSPGVELL